MLLKNNHIIVQKKEEILSNAAHTVKASLHCSNVAAAVLNTIKTAPAAYTVLVNVYKELLQTRVFGSIEMGKVERGIGRVTDEVL